jgi:hypothetical protein
MAGEEAAHPRSEPIVGIGILPFKHPAEVDAVVARIMNG